MACLICKSAAEDIATIGDWQEKRCLGGCGSYRVAGTLVATIRNRGQSFDIERTRLWLEVNRVTHPAPLITSSTVMYA
jgi:hypothetical protein